MPTSEIKLPRSIYFEPDRLIAARQRLPLTTDNYVPIEVYDRSLQMVEPRLHRLGNGALSISAERPFGFLTGTTVGVAKASHRTPKTDEIILACDPDEQNKWLATFETPEPLTGADNDLFIRGINLYVVYAQCKLLNLQYPNRP